MFASRVFAVILLTASIVAVAQAETPAPDAGHSWLSLGQLLAAEAERPAEPEPIATPTKAPPWPLHNIEGVGGGPLTPVALMCNCPPEGVVFGNPSVSFTYIGIDTKNVQTLAISSMVTQRFEVAYAFSRFGLGSNVNAIRKAGLGINRGDVYLHTFSLRGMILRDGEFDCPYLPALTAGVHYKVNGGIRGIDDSANGALSGIGFDRSNGADFTLTASKLIPPTFVGKPLILSAGVRNSQAAQLGYLGFGGECVFTVEGSIICLWSEKLAFGYEFRQKANPYDTVPGVLNDEDSWHSIFVGYAINNNLTLAGGWAWLGDVGNTPDTCGWAMQVKYEF